MDKDLVDRIVRDLSTFQAQLNEAAPRESQLGPDRAVWLAGIVALSPDVICVLDVDGTVLYVNRSPSGRDPQSGVGLKLADMLPKEHRELWRRAFERALETGATQQIELQSPGDLWWESRIALLKGAGGNVDYVLSIGTDITARKRAEAALTFKEQQLTLALQASGMGQWRWDVENDDVIWDAQTRTLFEWPNDDSRITFEMFLERVHPSHRSRVREHVDHALRSGVYPDIEVRLLLPSHQERWLLSTGRVIRGPTGALALIGGVIDLTASKLRESGLERARKLEAIGQLAGGVAHDFNNLLVAITGGIELARSERDPTSRDALLSEAFEASRRAADLTRQLLAFSRKQPLHEAAVDLNDLLRDTMKLLRRLIPESIQLELIEGHRVPKFLGDRGQIEQVVINLCINARDAIPSGGRVVLETEVVLVNGRFRETHPWARPGRYTLLSISDNGHGMDAETLNRVFEPFFTTKEHGTGLGLATAYGIVKQHGGLLHAYSELGKGSTFKVYLPVAERHAHEVGSKIEEPVTGGTETILLAEDEDPVRTIVRRILSQAGYQVLIASNGAEAVELFKLHQASIRLVLLDAIMPARSGAEALAEIRQIAPDMPAVISSGYSDALASVRHAGVDFLQKPYEPDALLRVVRQSLDKR
jgi:PAS domain S-box-containing protein